MAAIPPKLSISLRPTLTNQLRITAPNNQVDRITQIVRAELVALLTEPQPKGEPVKAGALRNDELQDTLPTILGSSEK